MSKKTVSVSPEQQVHLVISPPNFKVAAFKIVGEAALVMHRFSQKAEIMKKQEEGSTGKKGKKRDPKDFQLMYEKSMYISHDGKYGIPCSAFRQAMITACSLVGFHMTKAKMSVFVLPDGYDKEEHTPLTYITKGEPHRNDSPVRLDSGVIDIHSRAMWDPGWEATVQIRFDADQFTLQDVTNLMCRAGLQVGVLEGRPFSKDSAGCGWGTFNLKQESK